MRTIVIPEDELKRLEGRFGPDVRRMGPWNSDGVFGYLSISIGSVESAADAVAQPGLQEAVSRLKDSREPLAAFADLVDAFGLDLVAGIKTAYLGTAISTVYRRPAGCSNPAAERTAGAATAA
jgi:hypothetical protein